MDSPGGPQALTHKSFVGATTENATEQQLVFPIPGIDTSAFDQLRKDFIERGALPPEGQQRDLFLWEFFKQVKALPNQASLDLTHYYQFICKNSPMVEIWANSIFVLKEIKELCEILKNVDSIRAFTVQGWGNFNDAKNPTKELTAVELMKLAVDIIKNNPELNSLKFDTCHIGKNGIEILVPALKEIGHPFSLSLNGNVIGDEGAQILAAEVATNNKLTDLSIYDCDIGQNNQNGVIAIANAIAVNTSLTSLNFGKNRCEPVGTQAMASALEKNLRIQWLGLAFTEIYNTEAKALVTPLKKNPNLKIDLTQTMVGSEALTTFKEFSQRVTLGEAEDLFGTAELKQRLGLQQ